MSGQGIENEDPNVIAQRAERELNSSSMKEGRIPTGSSVNDSEAGVNTDVEKSFPGAQVHTGSTGASNNKDIPAEEGGFINPATGKQTKAKDFDGIGGPQDKMAQAEAQRPGDDDIHGNVRQKGTTAGETKRPNPTGGDVQ